ncbi:MAG: HEAT repeat domain-containing protein [Phycisphaerae bacterium]
MPEDKPKSGDQGSTAQRVEKAFEAARDGNMGPVAELHELGEAVVGFLGKYLKDPDANIRREAVALLRAVGGKAALPLLARALGDPLVEIQERAAMALYERYDPETLAKSTEVSAALRKSVKAGNTRAAAILLLGYFPGPETQQLLSELRGKPAEDLTKLHEWSPTVPVSLAATVALSRLGENDARAGLLEAIENAGVNVLEFLFAVVRDIDSPEVLQALKPALDNQAEVSSGVPSGAAPRRRICDVAVNAFVGRLKLEVDFELSESGRYTEAQVQQVRQQIGGAIPS